MLIHDTDCACYWCCCCCNWWWWWWHRGWYWCCAVPGSVARASLWRWASSLSGWDTKASSTCSRPSRYSEPSGQPWFRTRYAHVEGLFLFCFKLLATQTILRRGLVAPHQSVYRWLRPTSRMKNWLVEWERERENYSIADKPLWSTTSQQLTRRTALHIPVLARRPSTTTGFSTGK